MSVDDRLRDHFRQRRNEQAFAVIETDRSPMMRRILNGELVNLSGFPRRPTGELVLPFLPDRNIDYCDLEHNALVWIIVREHATGELIASTRPDNTLSPDHDCLWLR